MYMIRFAVVSKPNHIFVIPATFHWSDTDLSPKRGQDIFDGIKHVLFTEHNLSVAQSQIDLQAMFPIN